MRTDALVSLMQAAQQKLSEVEIIRYQVLMPVTEVQVRSVGSGRDSACSMGSGSGEPLPNPNLTEEMTATTPGGSSTPQFIWELIHLRCTQMPGGTQRRTEKVYQLSNRSVFSRERQGHQEV